MAEVLMTCSPLPGGAVVRNGVSISAGPGMSRYSLRAREDAVLAAVIGRPLPAAIGAVAGNIARLGPDEFLALLPESEGLPSGDGQPVSIVDVSDRSVSILVEGQGAAELIMSGCPLDLERMAPGRATRTIYETVEIVLLRESETRFHIEVWRSFAGWLWQSLATA